MIEKIVSIEIFNGIYKVDTVHDTYMIERPRIFAVSNFGRVLTKEIINTAYSDFTKTEWVEITPEIKDER